MNKPILLIAAIMSCLSASAQKVKENQVPQVVRDAFKNSFNESKKIKWEKENGNYEVEFERAGKEESVVFNPSGSILESEVEIKAEELPAETREYVAKNYKAKKIKEASRISDAQGLTRFEAEVGGRDLIFDSSGKFIKEEIEIKDKKN
jgi:hypothetical protein